jgi:hypothetical protein
MAANPDLTSFSRTVEALEPWLDQIVVIGGWAHRLYRYHPLSQQLDYPPLTTLDADIAVPNPLSNTLETDIRERLVKAGLKKNSLARRTRPRRTSVWKRTVLASMPSF